MLLEELLPFYFLIMIFVIMFTGHIPIMFELYIVYGFAFGVAMYNNVLYRDNYKLKLWGENVLDTVDILESENKALRYAVQEMAYELEMVKSEGNSVGVRNNDDDGLYKDI